MRRLRHAWIRLYRIIVMPECVMGTSAERQHLAFPAEDAGFESAAGLKCGTSVRDLN